MSQRRRTIALQPPLKALAELGAVPLDEQRLYSAPASGSGITKVFKVHYKGREGFWLVGLLGFWLVGLWRFWLVGLWRFWLAGLWRFWLAGLWRFWLASLWRFWLVGLLLRRMVADRGWGGTLVFRLVLPRSLIQCNTIALLCGLVSVLRAVFSGACVALCVALGDDLLVDSWGGLLCR